MCLSTTGGFAVLDASSGKGLWAHAHRIAGLRLPFGRPVIDRGAIYLTDDGGDLGSFRLDRDETRWGVPGSNLALRHAAIAADGDLVVGCGPAGLTAYDSATGKQRWSTPADLGIILSTDVVIAGDIVLAVPQPGTVQNERTVFAFNRADGAKKWTYTAKGDLGGLPVVAGGVVYVPANGFLHAVDGATGAERWTVATDKGRFGTPAVAGGTVYSFALRIGANDLKDINDYLYAIAA